MMTYFLSRRSNLSSQSSAPLLTTKVRGTTYMAWSFRHPVLKAHKTVMALYLASKRQLHLWTNGSTSRPTQRPIRVESLCAMPSDRLPRGRWSHYPHKLLDCAGCVASRKNVWPKTRTRLTVRGCWDFWWRSTPIACATSFQPTL